jgi:gentisate 1,2-dioxygenase
VTTPAKTPHEPPPSAAPGPDPDFYPGLKDQHLSPLWQLMGGIDRTPTTTLRPHLWRYDRTRAALMRAGDVVPLEDAGRRVLGFRNPGLTAELRTSATENLWAALQLVLPGEFAPPHRHTPSALRFIIEGDGAYTVVNGQRVPMERGDFLLTPSGHWHEHGHTGDGPMIWLDGLDSPFVNKLGLYTLQDGDAPQHVEPALPDPLATGTVVPAWDVPPAAVEQPLVFKLRDALDVIAYLREGPGDPYDDVIVEYRNPRTDGPVMTNIAAFLQLVRPGVDTAAHRHTHGTVYHVVRGSGHSVIDGERYAWTEGDTFAVPLWAEHSHHNPGSDDALVFSYTDKPAVEALGLARTEASTRTA